MKLCIRCGRKKKNLEFHNDKRRTDGLFPYCKDCRRERTGVNKRVHRKIGELDGYIIVSGEKYPCILLSTGRVRVHRYVAEKKIGREIKKTESVHHVDGDKMNWSEENLVVINSSLHRRYEGHKIRGYAPILSCTTCGKTRTYSNNVINKGRIKPERYQCADCYYKSGGSGGRRKLLERYK